MSKQSKIIISKARKGLSYSDIAKEMGISYQAVNSVIHRERKRRERRRELRKVESFEQVKQALDSRLDGLAKREPVVISSLPAQPEQKRPGLIGRIINFFTGRV